MRWRRPRDLPRGTNAACHTQGCRPQRRPLATAPGSANRSLPASAPCSRLQRKDRPGGTCRA
eukprot:4227762-Pyramimonas_sp.AAC.1